MASSGTTVIDLYWLPLGAKVLAGVQEQDELLEDTIALVDGALETFVGRTRDAA
jgi:hypothetical protein